jgi:uncharacterized membrane protein
MVQTSNNSKEKRDDSDDSKESKDSNMEYTTRAILILGILIVSGFIIYDVTKPSEEYVLFSVLNQDMELGDYPSHLIVGQKINFYFYVENHLAETTEFNVKIYIGNSSSSINPKLGISNAQFLGNYSKMVVEGENWTSSQIEYQFQTTGSQFIGLELWQNQNDEWTYVENHTLMLRINVTLT